MLYDPAALQQARAARSGTRRRPWLSLLASLLELADGKAELLRHAERAWASATFAGTRHTVSLAFTGIDAIAAAETLIATLAEHEFALPGQIVADAAVTSIDQTMLPTPRLELEIELLLLEDR